MKEITKADLYKAITRLVNTKWDFDLNNLQTIIDYFYTELLEEYNQDKPEDEQYHWVDYNAKFDQWCVERITYLFQQ